ncbi:MAG: glucose-6-phosphate isomerase [Candidatus Aminicenantia bacterium]
MKKEKIILDFTFSLTPPIDEKNGLHLKEIEAYSSLAQSALINLNHLKPGFTLLPDLEDVKRWFDYGRQRANQIDNLVVVGIGGSSLGTDALFQALMPYYYNFFSREERRNKPRMFVLDNIDPNQIYSLFELISIPRSLFIVVSKSGSTTETLTNFLILKEKFISELGKKEYQKHIVVITDPDRGDLVKIARQEGYDIFPFPPGTGGRYSVLSPVGLLPLSFFNVNPEEVVRGAKEIKNKLSSERYNKNQALFSALLLILFFKKGKNIQVIMPYSVHLEKLAEWYCQLWAESLGKRYNRGGEEVNWGQTPVRVLGTKDQHSQLQLYIEGPSDKIITFWQVKKFSQDDKTPHFFPKYSSSEYLEGKYLSQVFLAEKEATEMALAKNNKPSLTFLLPEINPYFVGQFIYLLEMQTALAGEMLNLDAFNQPGVELVKKYSYGLLGREGFIKPDLADLKHYQI